MHLPSTKLLLASCDQLLARNSSTAVANRRLFACSDRTSLPRLSPNRQQSSQLVTFGGEFSKFSQFSSSKFVEFEALRSAPDTLGRYGSAVRANSKLSQFRRNGDKPNPRLLTDPGDRKQYRRCLTPNSTDNYYYCQRHYSSHLNLKRQLVIHSANENEYDSAKDKQIDEPVSAANRYSTGESDKRKVNDQRYAFDPHKAGYSSKTSLKFNATLSHPINHPIESDQAAGSSIDKPSVDQTVSSSSSQQPTTGQDFSDLINVRSIYRNNLLNQSDQGDLKKMSGISFKPKKALILTKFSRLEYERRRLTDYTEEEVKESLIRRGSDYESLLNHHNIHTKSKEHVAKTLSEFGIEHRIVNRFEYNQEQIDWADVIVTTGGDGTFLMAASKIFNKDKLVIGINSDPSRSVGYLCLQPSYSVNFRAALEKLASGDFRWVYRQRIRVSIKGEHALDAPAELHDQQLLHPEFRYLDLETHPLNRRSNSPHRPDNLEYEYQVLPVRALNDVFVGECLSSRVSYFELQIENKPFVKVKSSGVTICTGTGSTSWSFNINKISPQSVCTLFKIINEETNASLDMSDEQLTKSITKKFNDSLIFDVCKNSMAYTVRDPVYMGNGFDSDNRGFAEHMVVKSRMFDACVVIDGGLSYKFNDGSFAKFELLDEDQLKTVAF